MTAVAIINTFILCIVCRVSFIHVLRRGRRPLWCVQPSLITSFTSWVGWVQKGHKWTESGCQWRLCMLTSELTVHMFKCTVRRHICCPLIHDSSSWSSGCGLVCNLLTLHCTGYIETCIQHIVWFKPQQTSCGLSRTQISRPRSRSCRRLDIWVRD